MTHSKRKEAKTKNHIRSKLKNTSKQRHYRFCKMCLSFQTTWHKRYTNLMNSKQVKHSHLYFSVSVTWHWWMNIRTRPSPWNRVHLETLRVTLSRNSQHFMKPEGSLYVHKSLSLRPKSDQTQLLHTIHFYIILLSMLGSSKWSLFLPKFCMHFLCLMQGTCLRIKFLNEQTFSSLIHETIFNFLSCLILFITIIKVNICAFGSVQSYRIAPSLHNPLNFLPLNIKFIICPSVW